MRFCSLAALIAMAVQVLPLEAVYAGHDGKWDHSDSNNPVSPVSPGSQPGDEPKTENKPNPLIEGDPVSLRNGEFVRTETDLVLAGRGLDVTIERTYRSRREESGIFGYNWFCSYEIKLRKLSNGYIHLLDGTGRKDRYKYLGGGNYESPRGYHDTLVLAGSEYVRTLKDGTKQVFDLNGNLIRIEDRHGNQLLFSYKKVGGVDAKFPIMGISPYDIGTTPRVISMRYKIDRITDTIGRTVTFEYDANGRVDYIEDSGGRVVDYNIDDSGNLLSVTSPSYLPGPGLSPTTNTVSYTYSSGSTNPRLNFNLLTVTDAENQTYLTNVYDTQDRIEEQTYGGGTFYYQYVEYDLDVGDCDEEDPEDCPQFDPQEVGGVTTVTDRNGNVVEHTYNRIGNLVEKVVYTNRDVNPNDPSSFTTTYGYNDQGERTKVVFPEGNVIEYAYDSMGNLLEIRRKETDGPNGPDDIVTTMTYESTYNLVKTIDGPRENDTTTFEYDHESGPGTGNLERITYPLGGHSDFTYYSYGRLYTATDPNGNVTKYEYDANLCYLEKITEDYGGENYETSMTYNGFGYVTSVTDARLNTTTLMPNNLGQVIRITAPSPFSYLTKMTYDRNGNLEKLERETDTPGVWQTTDYTYTILDKVHTITDDAGNVTTYGYDANDNLESVTDAENNTTSYLYDERDLLYRVTDARTYFTRYTYDGNGNLSLLRDARGKETSYSYDGFDRLETTTYPDTTTEVLAYDKASNITSRKNRKNQTIAYTYDALNRLDTKTPPDTGLVDYDYDPGSRLTDVTDADGTTHYDYVPGVNRLESVTYDYTWADPRTVSYLYDANGNRTRLTYPGSDYITYVWDQMNRLDMVKDSAENVIADYTYDTLSRRTQADLLNGTRAEYGYDEIDRLTGLLNKRVTPETNFSEYLFALYDNVGNLKQMSRDGEGYTFAYDTIYQLKTTDYPESHHSTDKTYNYDSLGNRTSVTNGGLESYTTNNLNQYTYVSGTAFSYDNGGNLTSDGTNTYAYDSENRLTSTGSYTYTYDPFGRRVRKQGPGVDVTYVYDNNQVIEERDSGGAVLATYVHGAGIDECISMERGGETYYYHYDRLGSVVNLSDSSGDLVETYQYDAWGNADTYGAVGNPYFFTGRRYDPETGNYYYRARFYDPSIGRFLQVDPVGYYDGPNLYTYVTNNPVNSVDPLGLEVIVQWHRVAGNNFHTLIRITPDNQARYANDPRFNNVDANRSRFATLGAGPEGGLLVSNINRAGDRAPHQGGNVINRPKDCADEDAYIDRLFALDANYGDDLDYDLFPANPGNRRWWLADDGFNSNSYISGLLGASGVNAPAIPVNVPGWNRPVPANNFQPRP